MKRLKVSLPVILMFFMLGTFCIGMTEFVITGLLSQLSADFNVSIAKAGLLLSVYALGVALLGPLISLLMLKASLRTSLSALMAVFVISNLIAALSPNFTVLLLARLISATIHAPFFGITLVAAYQMSTPDKRTRSMASINGGLTLAILVGVPFGSYLGDILNWRLVFLLVSIIGAIVLIALWLVTPDHQQHHQPDIKRELRIFSNKNILLICMVILLGHSGVFMVYTFIEPLIREFTGFSVRMIIIALFICGCGAVTGNYLSGRVQPSMLTKHLALFFAALTLLFTTASVFIPLSYVTTFMFCFLFGTGVFGAVPLLNAKFVLAGKEAPALAGTLASSVFNLANASGAALGAFLLDTGAGFGGLTWVAACLTTLGLASTVLTYHKEDKPSFEEVKSA
ncbi:MFS transporter [Paenibacillus sp. P96]|uniref:MFS transporter n=1 Tax=Paenibacillus zeirhizosphaerae TaxID=2987519 RepID=A0ABT9FTS2_9BACL|nr:MFS transporter [Paenibacillus sp. P96]MDP4098129.1 MFS transporter [Paenibacillus sp. P96]